MGSKWTLLPAFWIVGVMIGLVPVAGQQVTVSTPYNQVTDSFFEHTGTSWGVRGNDWFFQFGPGSPNNAAPPFGGFDPSAGATFGFGGRGGGFLGNFSQGSRRSFASVTPSLTVPNGGFGTISDVSVSPFVMGYIPVVGAFPIMPPSPVAPVFPPVAYVPPGQVSGHPAVLQALQNASDESMPSGPREIGAHVRKPAGEDRVAALPQEPSPAGAEGYVPTGGGPASSQTSSAARPALGVAEAKRLHEAEIAQQDAQARQFLERGRFAQADGKFSLARIYYRMVVRRASPSLRQEAVDLLASLPASDQTTD